MHGCGGEVKKRVEGLAEMRNEEEMVGGLVNKSIKPRAGLTLNPYCGIGPEGGGFCSSQYKPCN